MKQLNLMCHKLFVAFERAFTIIYLQNVYEIYSTIYMKAGNHFS